MHSPISDQPHWPPLPFVIALRHFHHLADGETESWVVKLSCHFATQLKNGTEQRQRATAKSNGNSNGNGNRNSKQAMVESILKQHASKVIK
jgi:hypothetical protein